jgi:hypothetical protein
MAPSPDPKVHKKRARSPTDELFNPGHNQIAKSIRTTHASTSETAKNEYTLTEMNAINSRYKKLFRLAKKALVGEVFVAIVGFRPVPHEKRMCATRCLAFAAKMLGYGADILEGVWTHFRSC